MRKFRFLTVSILACCYLLAAARLFAQHGPGGPPPGGGGPPFGNQGAGGPPGPGIGPGGPMGTPSRSSEAGGAAEPTRSGLQIGPSGRWWDDRGFAKSLGLRPEQKKKMDDIFNANKSTILERYLSLQEEEAHLEDVTSATQLDEASIFTAIDRVAQARASLEKANAHMLLLIRGEMSKEQIDRLEHHR